MNNEPLTVKHFAQQRHGSQSARNSSLLMARFSCFIVSAACSLQPPSAAAQPPLEPPLAGRPAPFSNIVGSYTIAANATPTEVPVEAPITLRITIQGQGPAKYQPNRKYLKLFPERWANDFYIEPVPAEDRAQPAQHTWLFVWRLRPKHRQITAIDGIKLVYYEPTRQGGGRFQTEYADAIPIKVTAPRPAPALPENVPVRVLPPSFYELPAADAILTPPSSATAWPAWLLIVLLLVPPLLTIVGVRCAQRLAPDRGGRRPQHSGAARRALAALCVAGDDPVWIVFGRYLRERLDFPAVEPTPAEVRRFVRRRGASRPMADKLAAFLDACDKARFAGPASDGAAALRDEAGRLIHALEDDLCVP